jgi:hypothetical protein
MDEEEDYILYKQRLKADNEFLDTMIIMMAVQSSDIEERSPPLFEQRLLWKSILETHGTRDTFTRHLRMAQESFNQLLGYIQPVLEVDNAMAALRGGAILPEICLYCLIRWMAGGSYSDIYLFAGISRSSFYRVIWKTMEAIVLCPELKISFPQTLAECAAAANGFASVSTGDAITNCVSVCDGYLLVINTPPKESVANVRSYFSGHYKRNGVNIQAACDHLSRFTYFAVAGPGVMGDEQAASKECNLRELIEKLPTQYIVIGDAAYKCSEKLISIYSGHDKNNKDFDNFNFYASQLRIRIEMAFGMMYKKWGILWRPLQVDMDRLKLVALTIAMLHNYCINERLRLGEWDPCKRDNIFARGDSSIEETLSEVDAEKQSVNLPILGLSVVRGAMVNRIKILGLTRPKVDRFLQPHRVPMTAEEMDIAYGEVQLT